MKAGIFEPTSISTFSDVDAVYRQLDEYETALYANADRLKQQGRLIGDQDFECCTISLENGGDSHLLLLGGMGPLAGIYSMRHALQLYGKSHSITLFQACGVPKRSVDSDLSEILTHALSSALDFCPQNKEIKLIVLCNGAHRFMPDVLENEKINNHVRFCSLTHSVNKNKEIFDGKKSVVLQTQFSACSGIYGDIDALHTLHETEEIARLQSELTRMIDAVKAFDPPAVEENAVKVFEGLKRWGVQKVLLGCTELPVAVEYLKQRNIHHLEGLELVDPFHLALRELNAEVVFE